MKLKLHIILLVPALLFSCKDKEEIMPAQTELGKYQLEQKGNNFDVINTIELKVGGNVIGSGIVQNSGESEDLGYNYYYTGTYTITDDVISIFQESFFQLGKPGQLFDSREMLVLVQAGSESLDYSIQSDFKELHFICPPNALCLEERIFKRVD